MVKRVGGFRRKSRSKLRKPVGERGRLNITKFFQQFSMNEIVSLSADSSYQNGMYHPRFHGKTGRISGKQGSCYYVSIKDGNKEKKIIVHSVHLKKVK